MRTANKVRLVLLLLPSALVAQESRGWAEIAAQGFYAPGDFEAARATSGVAARFHYVLPTGALLEGRAENYASSGLKLTENYLTLRGFKAGAWKMEFTAGDFLTLPRALDFTLPQVYSPQLRLRGARAEAIRGRLAWTGYAGILTLLEGPRLPFSLLGPQSLAGGSVRWAATETLEFAGQVNILATDPDRAAARSYLFQAGRQYSRASQSAASAQWKPRDGIRVFGELAHTTGAPMDRLTVRPARGNAMGAAEVDRRWFMFRGSWLRQTAGYTPVAGYFSGDRGGGLMESRLQPFRWFSLFGSAGSLRNNFENNPAAWTFRTKMSNAGAILELPGRFSITAQVSSIRLASLLPRQMESRDTRNQQYMLMASKGYGRYLTRVSWRAFDIRSQPAPVRQNAAEAEQVVRAGTWTASVAVRLNEAVGEHRRNTAFVRGMLQGRVGRVTMHAYSEVGRDLANETLFALNQIQTTVAGFTAPVGKAWSVQGEVLRYSLATAMNPQSAFAMSSQGVPLQMMFAGMNRWNILFRVVRTLHWGGPVPAIATARTLEAMAPVSGALEGTVLDEEGEPLGGIPVVLDGHRIEYSKDNGRYRFVDVHAGEHIVELSPRELPAEFDPAGIGRARINVRSAKTERVDFSLRRLASLRGQVLGIPLSKAEELVLRIESSGRRTTPNDEGHFAFHNLPAGIYRVTVDESTIPSGYGLASPASIEIEIGPDGSNVDAVFVFKQFELVKPVRRVELNP
jgi:hypothetical protein